MLKRKLSRAGFFGNGLLLIATFNAGTITQETAKASKKLLPGTTIPQQKKSFAAVMNEDGIMQLQISDSSVVPFNELSEAESAEAPQIRLNPRAVKFVKDYVKNNDESLLNVKKRSQPYFKIIDSVFRKYDLPVELRYLAVIESDLRSSALSPVGARGPWQLMPVTARELGLKVRGKYDERTHYYKSTVAAAKYLRDLYAEFGDWLLVIAAYNGGPGSVNRAIHKSGSRNFWYLQKSLPAETRSHVKRFIGTHYYFEGHGSVTTLTKAEVSAHKKAVSEFMANRNQDSKENPASDSFESNAEKAIASTDGNSDLKMKKEK